MNVHHHQVGWSRSAFLSPVFGSGLQEISRRHQDQGGGEEGWDLAAYNEPASCFPDWAVGAPPAPRCLAPLRSVAVSGPAVSAWPAILGLCSLEMGR